MPAILLAAPIMTVASFILRKGSVKAAKKYGPKLIKKAKDYIDKNKLILSGNKVIKPPKGSITKIKGGKGGPSKVKSNKKDSFDEALKKKEGAAKFNKLNKTVQTKNPKIKTKNKINKAPKAYVDKFGNPHRTAAGADRANKLNKNPRIKTKNKKKNKIDDTKTVTNVNKTPIVAPKIKKVAKIGAGLVLGGLAVDQASKVLSNIGKTSSSGPSTFAAAFKKARKEKGPNSTFTYKGKQYSTVTVDQYQKAGFNSLREYLNAQKKK